jgi:hypothetical protein
LTGNEPEIRNFLTAFPILGQDLQLRFYILLGLCSNRVQTDLIFILGINAFTLPEPVYVTVKGAQESIPPAYVYWRAGTTSSDPRGWESIHWLLKRFTNTASVRQNWKKKSILNLEWSVALWTDLILGVARVVHQVTQAVKHDLVAPTKLPVQNCKVKR